MKWILTFWGENIDFSFKVPEEACIISFRNFATDLPAYVLSYLPRYFEYYWF